MHRVQKSKVPTGSSWLAKSDSTYISRFHLYRSTACKRTTHSLWKYVALKNGRSFDTALLELTPYCFTRQKFSFPNNCAFDLWFQFRNFFSHLATSDRVHLIRLLLENNYINMTNHRGVATVFQLFSSA